MRNYDLSPLFRSTVGFDRLARLVDGATRFEDASAGYPPYNIEKLGEEDYRVTMAATESVHDRRVADPKRLRAGRKDTARHFDFARRPR